LIYKKSEIYYTSTTCELAGYFFT